MRTVRLGMESRNVEKQDKKNKYMRTKMEKLVKDLSALSLACLLGAGCTQEDKLPSQVGEDGQPVPLCVEQAEFLTSVVSTRATTTALGAGSSIGVFIDNDASSTSYTRRDNVRYNRGDAQWAVAVAAEPIGLRSEDAVVCAYYPYNSTVTDSKNVNLKPALLADGMEPLAYATNTTVNSNNRKVTFTLKQAYAWLQLNLTRAAGLTEDVTVTQVILTGPGMSEDYVMNITDGTEVSKTAATDDRIVLDTPETPLVKGAASPVTFNLSLPPTAAGAITGGLTVGVKLKELGKVMMIKLSAITGLERGYKYTANLTVNGSALKVSSVEVTAWTPSTVNNGGNAYVPLP